MSLINGIKERWNRWCEMRGKNEFKLVVEVGVLDMFIRLVMIEIVGG